MISDTEIILVETLLLWVLEFISNLFFRKTKMLVMEQYVRICQIHSIKSIDSYLYLDNIDIGCGIWIGFIFISYCNIRRKSQRHFFGQETFQRMLYSLKMY